MTEHVFVETAGTPGAPLIMTFHGTGGSETDLHGFAAGLLPGAHVVSPRGNVSENGMARFFRRDAVGVYDMADLARRSDVLADFVGAARDRVGATRVIGMGYSNGANIIANVSFTRPGLFTDLILMHSQIPWEPDPQPGLAAARVLITAGERDPVCPPEETRRLIAWYADQGAEVQDHWHPGGHEMARSEVGAIQQFLAG